MPGRPIPNSNADRAVKAVLKASELDHDLIKLSELHVSPCQTYKRCMRDSVCKEEDDFMWFATKIKKADALVIRAYSPSNFINAYTEAFMERF